MRFIKILSCHTTRVAARVNDLKKKGYKIVSIPERKGDSIGCRYFLQSLPIKEKPKYLFVDNRAILIEKPIQENLF